MALRLKDMGDMRRFLASLINSVRTGEMPAEQASKLTYICNVMIKCMALCWEQGRGQELEQRMDELESRLNKGE